MRGSIHDAVLRIKSSRQSLVLIQYDDHYRTVSPNSIGGIKALDPVVGKIDQVVGVFTKSVPVRDIYEAAGEPVPVMQGD